MSGALHLLRTNRDYRKIWFSGGFSGFGDHVFETTLILWIVTELASGKSWAPTVTSLLIAASAIPVLLVGPFAGVLADRWNPRSMRIAASALSGLLILALATTATGAISLASGVHIGLILATVALASTVAQFLAPAAAVMLREIVTDTDLPVAAGASQTVNNLNILIAPALAATLFAAFGPFVGLLINAASFAVATLLITTVANRATWQERVTSPRPTGYWSDFRDGIGQFGQFPILRIVSVSMAVVMIGAGMLNGPGIFFVLENLGGNERHVGLITSAQGVGMLVGSAIATWVVTRLAVRDVLWIGVLGLGMGLLVYARLTSIYPAFVVIAVIGICVAMLPVTIIPLIMTSVPREYIGRVTSLLNPLLNLGSLTGLAVGGVAYSILIGSFDVSIGGMSFRPLDTIFTVAALITIVAGLYLRASFRRLDATPTTELGAAPA
jgi:MFS family permease